MHDAIVSAVRVADPAIIGVELANVFDKRLDQAAVVVTAVIIVANWDVYLNVPAIEKVKVAASTSGPFGVTPVSLVFHGVDGAEEIGNDVRGAFRDGDGDGDKVDVGIAQWAGMPEDTLLSVIRAHGDIDEAPAEEAAVVEVVDGMSQLTRGQGGCMAASAVFVVHGGQKIRPGVWGGGGPVTHVRDRLCAAWYMALLARARTGRFGFGFGLQVDHAFRVADAVSVAAGVVGGVLRAVGLAGVGHRGGKDRGGCGEEE